MTSSNFDQMILNDIMPESPWINKKSATIKHRPNEYPMDASQLSDFTSQLQAEATSLISSRLSEHSLILPEDIFSKTQVNHVVERLVELNSKEDVRVAIGGHYVDGLVPRLHQVIMDFKRGDIYLSHVKKMTSLEQDKFVKKTAFKYLNENQKKRKSELREIDAAQKMLKLAKENK